MTVRGPVEHFHVLYLDRKNRVIFDELLSVGTVCVFRNIRPPIPITSGHLLRRIRPPMTRCREAACFGYQV